MANFILTCCSTVDLSRAFLDARQIPFVSFHFTMEGREYADDLGASMPFDDFYARIAAGAQPTTSQVNEGEFIDFFTPFLEQGHDIVHISLSSGLSGAYQSACIARDELCAKYPGRTIEVIDSLGASSGYGLLTAFAADLRDEGLSAAEAAARIRARRLQVHHWFFSTDLTSYYRGGRISKGSAVFGTLLGICPLLNMDHLGRLIPRSKYRGKKRVIEEIVNRMAEHAEGGTAYSGRCFLSHSACYADARAVADAVEARFPKLDGKVVINSVGTVIGAHTGPGTVALFFFGDERVD
ncbi:MAG: DegV family protein [Clostridia bacterium]|nr:DegV family protein [Clostridia bacterium]